MKKTLIELDAKTYKTLLDLSWDTSSPLEDCISIMVSGMVNNLSPSDLMDMFCMFREGGVEVKND